MNISDVRVLVVDDVHAMRIQLKEILRSFGFQSIENASNGLEAQKVMEKQEFELVLSDWYMEPVNGLQLLEWVKANPKTKKTVFVMVTAENIREEVMKAIVAGVDGYIVKPLTMQQISTKVVGMLKKRGIVQDYEKL